MRRFAVLSLATALSISLLVAGCTQAAPEPTKAPAAPTKAAEPTKTAAPAVQPTAAPTVAPQPTKLVAPAKPQNFAEPGKSVSLIVGFPPGGGAGMGAQLLSVPLEKEIGVPAQVVYKAGAGSQLGVTFTAQSKPDGYTLGYANWPTMVMLYRDPDRAAAFGRKDVQPVAMHLLDPQAFAVQADSPYKSIKDLVDAAKAKPASIKMGTSGPLSPEHLAISQLMEVTGVKFAVVHFDGGGPQLTALLGGHIDVFTGGLAAPAPQAKAGKLRVVGTMHEKARDFVPDVKTFEEQGYKGFFPQTRGWFYPAAVPKEIVNYTSASIKKAMESPDHLSRIGETSQVAYYLSPAEMEKYWEEQESWVPRIMDIAKKQSAQ